MAEFVPGQDIKTEAPTIEVTINPDRPLAVGRHQFRLVVADDAGNVSVPDEIVVIVADQSAPTAVLSGPRVVGSGQSFELDGRRSFDAGGGQVVSYSWTLLG